jgi:hypothetical protein
VPYIVRDGQWQCGITPTYSPVHGAPSTSKGDTKRASGSEVTAF